MTTFNSNCNNPHSQELPQKTWLYSELLSKRVVKFPIPPVKSLLARWSPVSLGLTCQTLNKLITWLFLHLQIFSMAAVTCLVITTELKKSKLIDGSSLEVVTSTILFSIFGMSVILNMMLLFASCQVSQADCSIQIHTVRRTATNILHAICQSCLSLTWLYVAEAKFRIIFKYSFQEFSDYWFNVLKPTNYCFLCKILIIFTL